MGLRITLLGGLKVVDRERIITRFRTQTTAALLAYLAYHGDHSHSREMLADLLWPEGLSEAGRVNLRQCLAAIRSIGAPDKRVAPDNVGPAQTRHGRRLTNSGTNLLIE